MTQQIKCSHYFVRFPISRHRDLHFVTSSPRLFWPDLHRTVADSHFLSCTVRTVSAVQTMQLCFRTAEPRKFQFPCLLVLTFRAPILRIGSATDPQNYTVCDNKGFRSETVRLLWRLSRVWSWLIVTWQPSSCYEWGFRWNITVSSIQQYIEVHSSILQYTAVYCNI